AQSEYAFDRPEAHSSEADREAISPMGADGAPLKGDHHVTQTLACCSCRGIAGCCGARPDLGLRLGRLLAPWLARRLLPQLGQPALLCRWTRLLRLWRLLCPPACSDPLGTPLAARQPLLLTAPPNTPKAPAPPGL